MSWRAGSSGFTGAHTGTTLGFYGTTPTTRPTAYTQTYSTTSRTVPATVAAKPAATGATSVTPYGFTTAAQADAIRACTSNLVDDVNNIKQVLNSVIDDLQALGLLQ